MTRAAATLAALIEATPEPPTDVDAGELVEAGVAMVEDRRRPFAALELLLAEAPDAIDSDPEAHELLAELRRLDAAWNRALEGARVELEKRVTGVRRLRQRRR